MKKLSKGLSSSQTFFIFGCGVSFFGTILSNTIMIWAGLWLIVIGVISWSIGKIRRFNIVKKSL